jgi:hypothetical protein
MARNIHVKLLIKAGKETKDTAMKETLGFALKLALLIFWPSAEEFALQI